MKPVFTKLRTATLLALASATAMLPMATMAAAASRLYGAMTNGLANPAQSGTVLGANGLTGLIPTIYTAADTISREMVGLITAVHRNSTAESAAVGQDVTYPITPTPVAQDIVAGQLPPDTGDQNIDKGTMKIDKSRMVPVRWSGEEQKAVGPNGTYNQILADQFVQAMRTLVNEVEADLGSLYVFGSRAYGTAGTTPFGTKDDFSDFAGMLQILDDNGAPPLDRHLGLGSAAIANIRGKQSSLFKANEAGTTELLRRGMINEVEGFGIHYSSGIKQHTKGTGASYQSNNASGYVVGDSGIAVDTGTGTVLAGDILTFTGDTNKYVNGTALAGGSLALNQPGLRQGLADNVAMAVGNSYRANMAFHKDAIHLVTRSPAMPEGGDMADDVMTVVDPVSGLVFQVALYRTYRRVQYEVGLAWGKKAVKPAHISVLLG